MSQTQELLTSEQVAERMQVTVSTVQRWTRLGKIPAIELANNVVRYEWAAVLAALRKFKKQGSGK